MFLSCTSQGVDIVVKWLISLVVTSNHKCLNKIVSNKLALIIFEPGTQPQRWYIFGTQCGAQNKVNTLSWSSEIEKGYVSSYIHLSGVCRI